MLALFFKIMERFKLNRTTQCAKCPWKKGVNPFDIPNGYDIEKHKKLAETIADTNTIDLSIRKVMACHESQNDYCIGYLHNQLGEGNNIPLRIKFLHCENADKIKTVGPQHKKFKNTIPK